MPDLLVKLYTLPELAPLLAKQREAGIEIRRALAPEKHIVVEWVREQFNAAWASECDVSFSSQPVACLLAINDARQLIGFACYDATCKNFFGPLGVAEPFRGTGIGTALLVACLHAMAAAGYAYAIIGSAGPSDFYRRTVGAIEIEGSTPGIYRGLLRG